MTAVVLQAERRELSRCLLDARAELRVGSHVVPCQVKDVSLQGMLLRTRSPLLVAVEGQPCTVTAHLGVGTPVIVMQAKIAHVREEQVGIACREIDLDSFVHLRRVVDLNLAEEKLALGELATLTQRPR